MVQLLKRLGDASFGIKDLDSTKGIVSGYFAAFDSKDSDDDIIRKGAFAKTIAENGPKAKARIKHCLDHRRDQVVAKLINLEEDAYGLKYESQVGRDTKSRDYLMMCEDGYITEHSIGYNTIKSEYDQEAEAYNLLELKLYEGSGLQFWGANPNTPLIGIKSDAPLLVDDLADLFLMLQKSVRTGKYSDETFTDVIIPAIAQINELLKARTTEPEKPTQPEVPDYADFDNRLKSQFSLN